MATSSMRWTIGKNTIAQTVGKIIGAGITFIITLIIAERFGANGYGDFTKITTYIAFFYLVADFGMNAVFLHNIEGKSVREGHALWHALVAARIVLSFVLILVSLLIIALIPKGVGQGYTDFVKIGILLYSPTIAFQSLLTSANAIFQKKFRYDLSTIASTAGSITSLFLVAIASVNGKTILPVTASLLIGTMVTAAISLFFAMRLHEAWEFSFDVENVKKLIISSAPLAATLLFNLVYFRIDSVILTLTKSTSDVGIYGFAYKIFEFPLVLPTFFMNSLYPLFLTTFNSSKKKFIILITKSAGILLAASLVGVAGFWVGAPIISFIKPEFNPSIPVLRILVTSLPFFFVSSLTMWALITLKKQWILAGIYFFAMLVNLSLNILFIPTYGYFAAAWITVISEGLVLVISGLFLIQSIV